MFLLVALIGNLLNRSPFLSPKSVHIVVQDTQEEMRYEGSLVKSTPAFKKKDDTAYTYAKFVPPL